MKTREKNKKIILWTVLAVVVIIAFTIVLNWESFSEGFEAGSRLAE